MAQRCATDKPIAPSPWQLRVIHGSAVRPTSRGMTGASAIMWRLLFLSGAWVFLTNTPATAVRKDHQLVYDNMVIRDRQGNTVFYIGRPAPAAFWRPCAQANADDTLECRTLEDADGGRRTLRVRQLGSCVDVTDRTNMVIPDTCANLGAAHWYGGGEEIPQKWPLEKYVDLKHPLVTQAAGNRGVQETFWFNSEGISWYVYPGAPAFLKLNVSEDAFRGKLCVQTSLHPPYRPRPGGEYEFHYVVCQHRNAKEAFRHAVKNYLRRPTAYPDERMIKYPLWSTWARYKSHIDEVIVREFAKEIKERGFKNSQLELDDRWETCYGSKMVDKHRFPNMKQLVDDLKKDGFRVTIWTHPFIENGCSPTLDEAKERGFLVMSTNGSEQTNWWNGRASIIDFTQQPAADWFVDRHETFMKVNGIDGFKFDAGETSWNPQLPILNVTPAADEDYPSLATRRYVEACARFGSLTEVRSASRTQHLPIFLRMLDKDSRWGDDNGLKSVVTTLLQMNMVGYSMVLPDMIGGNQYNAEVATRELFVRWLQACTFMPAMQYALVPWDYSGDGGELSKFANVRFHFSHSLDGPNHKKFNDLHELFGEHIINAMKRNVQDGTPVNPPVWWIDPTNKEALEEDSEYLLGENLLVAPVLEKGATRREVFLPTGEWKDANTKVVYAGPIRVTIDAPLDTLPWFVRHGSDSDQVWENASPEIYPAVINVP